MARDRPSVTLERLEQAASSLRPIEREVLVLSARERLSSNEIAARLGITSSAVDRFLARALCKLDRALERREQPWWKFW
jgi:RNA polymerase sigma factor (sigma-70 family)